MARAPQPAARRTRLPRTVFLTGVAVTAALFAAGAWEHRWIADDGLIVLRTVRNLLAGNGPVFNVDERVETNTSAAWTYLVWFFSWLTQARLEYVVLGLTLTLSVTAVVVGMLGSARLWGGPAGRLLLPAGALVYIALPPARDYASSGLESGLVICWLAVLWYFMIRWAQAGAVRPAGYFGLVFLAGLAPLIRPEITLVGALALLVLVFAPVPETSLRPWVFRLLTVAVAGLVPIGYQIWRMGYYGLPYPNTAVSKDAGGAKWQQGFTYLGDFVGPYHLWLPLLILAVSAFVIVRPQRLSTPALRSPAMVVLVMLVSGVALTVYELRVGGDFMHGRMLLPQLFCLLLPVMVLPVRLSGNAAHGNRVRWLVPAGVVITAAWALWACGTCAVQTGTSVGASGIVDERIYYVLGTGHDHPIRAEDYLDYARMRPMLRHIGETPDGALLLNLPSQMVWHIVPPPLPVPEGGAGHTVFFLNLGMTSMNVPLDVRVVDQMGLAYPLAAHTDRLENGRIGHDKNLAPGWVVVDAEMVDRQPWIPLHIDERYVIRARAALSCPATQDLLASTRAPLTFTRFRHNIQQAFGFASYRTNRNPSYELQRCGLEDPIQPVAPR
ncbi:flagellar motor control protein ZomB [Nocardia huaxiensis]|uniref:flagellar motor control protein ZomB n=1 Tax=Nocardia huaxiensis TaxID=2755382 RepID=UPI001FD112D3|nr:flagellar motor control protein ZomB [Nocardia huaxiensis]